MKGGRGGVATAGLWRDLLVFAFLAALAAAEAWVRVEGTLAGYRLSAAQAEEHRLLREREELRLELASRKASFRIEKAAVDGLGLVPPTTTIVIPAAGPREAAR